MAAELKQAWPVTDVRLVASSGGVFEVKLDGEELLIMKESDIMGVIA